METNDELHALLLASFAEEATEQLGTIHRDVLALEKAAHPAERRPLLEEIFREAHSLKGASRAVRLDRVEAVAHELETLFVKLQSGELAPDGETFDLVYEALVTVGAMVAEVAAGQQPSVEVGEVCTALQETGTALSPALFDANLEAIRDLARQLGKDVDVVVEGVGTDRALLGRLRVPLTHMLRNACDHGIEAPEEREAAGKPRQGTVILRACRDGDLIRIDVADDGGGIDARELRDCAVRRGLMSREAAEALSREQALALIFTPGFSTRTAVTEVSGRGIGMDVVRDHAQRLAGTVRVETEPGTGTTFSIFLSGRLF